MVRVVAKRETVVKLMDCVVAKPEAFVEFMIRVVAEPEAVVKLMARVVAERETLMNSRGGRRRARDCRKFMVGLSQSVRLSRNSWQDRRRA